MPSRYMLASFKTCPWVQRAIIVLLEKGIEYDIDYIDKNNRPDWFLAISPHSKVPVLRVDDEQPLFESCAIAEYLDEVAEPRLHPEDPLHRAVNRAWTDFIPTFSGAITSTAYAPDEQTFVERRDGIAERFDPLEKALARRGSDGPYFNGAAFSLVDAGYAPSLQRYSFMDRVYPVGIIDDFPLLGAWRDALLARPSVAKSTVPEIETLWRENLKINNRWLARFVDGAAAA